MTTDRKKTTIAAYIVRRLVELGCKRVFGVPGTSCADLFTTVSGTAGIDAVITANELEAGYAADGYARFAGFGACCVAYGVGTLSLINAVAGCLVERVPVLVLNGGPSEQELENQSKYGVLFSHSTGRHALDFRLFREVCVSALVVDEHEDIAAKIDKLLTAALRECGPVYLEVANDMWLAQIDAPIGPLARAPSEDTGQCFEAFLAAATAMLARASKPAILVGVEGLRRQLRDSVVQMIEETGYPFATTVLSKSFIAESHPQFRGTYDTDLVVKPVRELLESSDCLIALGCVFGIDHLTLVSKQFDSMISVAFGQGRVGNEHFEGVDLKHALKTLRPASTRTVKESETGCPSSYALRRASWTAPVAEEPRRLTHEALFSTVDRFLAESSEPLLTVVDTCLGSFPSADLVMRAEHVYVANPVWLSIGHGTPAANGAYFATGRRPMIITGDGGFQMVVQSVSTMVRHRIPAILIIIDNGTYAIEQYLLDSCYFVRDAWTAIPFVELSNWRYDQMPALFGGGHGLQVNSVSELAEALRFALSLDSGPCIICARVPPNDMPPENRAFAESQCGADSQRRASASRWSLPRVRTLRQR